MLNDKIQTESTKKKWKVNIFFTSILGPLKRKQLHALFSDFSRLFLCNNHKHTYMF